MLVKPGRGMSRESGGVVGSLLDFGSTELWYSRKRSVSTDVGAGVISTVTDISGASGRNISQSNNARRPTLSTINGNVSWLFDGVDDDLSNTDFTTSFPATALTFACVMTPTDVTAVNRDPFRLRVAGGANRCSLRQAGTQSNVFYDGPGSGDLNLTVDNTFAANATRYVIGRLRISANSDVLWSNGLSNSATGPSDPATEVDQIFFGGQQTALCFMGHMHELAVWSKFFTSDERGALDAYLRNEWAISA